MYNCHHRRFRGVGLIVVGLLFVIGGLAHRHYCPDHRAQMERHIAEVCLRAAETMHK